MFDVLTVFVFDTEVVNDEGKVDVAGFMLEESICAGLVVSMFLELLVLLRGMGLIGRSSSLISRLLSPSRLGLSGLGSSDTLRTP